MSLKTNINKMLSVDFFTSQLIGASWFCEITTGCNKWTFKSSYFLGSEGDGANNGTSK